MRGRRPIALLALVAMLAALAACRGASADPPAADSGSSEVITIGSFDFPESHLLAEIYSQALEAHGYRVERAYDLGPREFVLPALVGGFVDFVPEYAGTALQFLSLGREPPQADHVATHDALVRTAERSRLRALASAPAENANAFVVTPETAEELGLATLSDLAAVDDQLIFGGPPECPTRRFCLIGLEKTYKVHFAEVVSLELDSRLTRQALQEELVDVALMFTTDPALDREELVELEDDLELQPAENVTPLVRSEIVERFGPRFVDVVDGVSARLTTDALHVLNGEVAIDGSGLQSVAGTWLAASGSAVRNVD